MKIPRKILVPIDFSEGAEAALDYAAGLSRRFGASVEVLHAIPEVIYRGPAQEETRRLIRLQAHSQASEQMAAALQALRSRTVGEVEGKVIAGDPVGTILERAEAGEADLVVMGTHGRSGLTRVILGSVAEEVLRRAPCPVLVIRPGPRPLSGGPARKGARP